VAKLNTMPSTAVIDGFKGVIDFYSWNGIPVARSWPRSPGHDRAPAVQATWQVFKDAVSLWPTLSPEIQAAYNEMAAESNMTGRDLFTKSYMVGLVESVG
jgi:hypothetical protein